MTTKYGVNDGIVTQFNSSVPITHKEVTREEAVKLAKESSTTKLSIDEQSKLTRNAALIDASESPIEYDGVMFDIDGAARANIETVIEIAEENGLPDSTIEGWRLADNSWRDTTLGELKSIIQLRNERYRAKFQSVWSQFNAWDSGDKSEPFEIV